MKKLISIIVCLALLCSSVQAVSTSVSQQDEGVKMLAPDGTIYYLGGEINGDIITSWLSDENHNLIQKSVYNKITGNVTTYFYSKTKSIFSSPTISHCNMNDFLVNTSATLTIDASPSSIPSYNFYDTYTTEYYNLEGKRLTGDAYCRELDVVREYEGTSYLFQKGVAFTVVTTYLTGLVHGNNAIAIVVAIVETLGINALGQTLTSSLNLYTARRDINWQFMCEMEYNNHDYRTAEINKTFEYIYARTSSQSEKETWQLDMISYSNEEDAINGSCYEVVGYGAQAYNYKFITGSRPDLALPVNGPVSTWT